MKEPTQRLFLALWPDEATRSRVTQLQARLPLSGRPVRPGNFHITLAFLGEVETRRLNTVRAAAANVDGPGFTLALDTLDYFRRSRTAWLGPESVPNQLTELHGGLTDALVAGQLMQDAGRFRPHVTLARKSMPLPNVAFEPVIWPVEDFVLVESHPGELGACYHVLERWSLEATP